MSPLRESMIEAMQLRGFAPRTQSSYLSAVHRLSAYFQRSPEALSASELEAYFRYLVLERGLSPASCRLHFHALRFLYLRVLESEQLEIEIVLPKRAQRIPDLLTRSEVGRLLRAVENVKHRMMLSLCYGCGLRVSELVAVRVADIDGERSQLRIEQGKGQKDRRVTISPSLLQALRGYWRVGRPRQWLFPSESRPRAPVTISTAQRTYSRAKARARIEKQGGIHALRHAFATHQLENGLPLHRLKLELGHKDLHSTMRYLHWVPELRRGRGHADLVGLLGVGDE